MGKRKWGRIYLCINVRGRYRLNTLDRLRFYHRGFLLIKKCLGVRLDWSELVTVSPLKMFISSCNMREREREREREGERQTDRCTKSWLKQRQRGGRERRKTKTEMRGEGGNGERERERERERVTVNQDDIMSFWCLYFLCQALTCLAQCLLVTCPLRLMLCLNHLIWFSSHHPPTFSLYPPFFFGEGC